MEKLLSLFFLIGFIFMSVNLKASITTGHQNINKIIFEGDGKILNEITDEQVNETKEYLGKKLFGWKTAYFNYKRKVYYEGDPVFSKVNHSSVPIYFEYQMTNEEVLKTSVVKEGSVSTKITGTIEKIKTTITGVIEGSIKSDNTTTDTVSEKTYFEINIMPGKKVSMVAKGEAYITTGYSNYTFFGIILRSGTWERLEIDTVYYEIIEEDVL